jgi:acetyl esterase/lipase
VGDTRDGRVWEHGGVGGAALRASLSLTPRAAIRALRRRFAATGAATNRALEDGAPSDVEWWFGEPYGPGRDERCDLYRPFDPTGSRSVLPTIAWVHGGAFVAGDPTDLRGWCCRLASRGFAVVAPSYSRAPEARYPTPVQQVLDLLAFLARERERLGIDPTRVVLAGDSAGAQIGAQVAAVLVDDDYAAAVGVECEAALPPPAGMLLCCGPYDLGLVDAHDGPFANFLTTVLWSYSGQRTFSTSPDFATFSVLRHLTPDFPPTFVTVGNADPLAPHTDALVDALRDQGVSVDDVRYPADHAPPLGHEYQFDLSLADARASFELMTAFAQRVTATR